jgi:hypothetical protein
MKDAYHLEGVRCDGQAHGGCEAACLVFWKAAWLKPVAAHKASAPKQCYSICSEAQVWDAVRRADDMGLDGSYCCQATQLPAASHPLPWWDLSQYAEDLASRNIGFRTLLRGVIYMAYQSLIRAGIGLGRPLRCLYDATVGLRRGFPYPRRKGMVPSGQKTPALELKLQPGEWVRVKSYEEILATLDQSSKNRGLYFDAEMVPYCNRTFRVLKRVNRIIDEPSGRMQEFKTPCIVLEGVVCEARYSECRLFCPRAIYSYWREIWLERVDPPAAAATSSSRGQSMSK